MQRKERDEKNAFFADLNQASDEADNAAFWHNLDSADTAANGAGDEPGGNNLGASSKQTSEAAATASDSNRGKGPAKPRTDPASNA